MSERPYHRLATVAITQANFDKLPALLHPWEFRMWSGIDERKLNKLTETGVVHVFHPDKGRTMFYKYELARLCGFRCDLPGSDPAATLHRVLELLAGLDAAGLPGLLAGMRPPNLPPNGAQRRPSPADPLTTRPPARKPTRT